MYRQWQEKPVITTITTPAHPISNVEFPTFTICAQGMNYEAMIAGFNKQFVAYLKEKQNYSLGMSPYEMIQCQNVSLDFIWIVMCFIVFLVR